MHSRNDNPALASWEETQLVSTYLTVNLLSAVSTAHWWDTVAKGPPGFSLPRKQHHQFLGCFIFMFNNHLSEKTPESGLFTEYITKWVNASCHTLSGSFWWQFQGFFFGFYPWWQAFCCPSATGLNTSMFFFVCFLNPQSRDNLSTSLIGYDPNITIFDIY